MIQIEAQSAFFFLSVHSYWYQAPQKKYLYINLPLLDAAVNIKHFAKESNWCRIMSKECYSPPPMRICPLKNLCNFTKIIIIFLNTCVLRQCCQLPFKAENTDNCLSDNTEILIMPRWQCPRVLLAFEMSWC